MQTYGALFQLEGIGDGSERGAEGARISHMRNMLLDRGLYYNISSDIQTSLMNDARSQEWLREVCALLDVCCWMLTARHVTVSELFQDDPSGEKDAPASSDPKRRKRKGVDAPAPTPSQRDLDKRTGPVTRVLSLIEGFISGCIAMRSNGKNVIRDTILAALRSEVNQRSTHILTRRQLTLLLCCILCCTDFAADTSVVLGND